MPTFKLLQRFVITALITALLITCTHQQDLVKGILKLLYEGEEQFRNEPDDTPKEDMLEEYDFIIVGAGSAGCVLANRLTENVDWKVLLIEAGRSENYLMDIPMFANYLQFTEANWGYLSEPSDKFCLGATNQQCSLPRGKVMGGSSVLNYMIYTKGNRRDYDRWAEMGNTGWSFDEVLPYFKKVENFTVPVPFDARYHNYDGPVDVSYSPFATPIVDAFINASIQYGIRPVDYNGQFQVGVSKLQHSMRDGVRESSSRSYLHPIHRRSNLHVKKHSMVTKILIDSETKVAYGVKFVRFGKIYTVRAKKEVIISAGAFNSPQLLMLSGIGPEEHLAEHGIPVLSNLKVGFNLMDHVALIGFTYLLNKPYGFVTSRVITNISNLNLYVNNHTGPFSSATTETLIFYDSNDPTNPDGYPDIEVIISSVSLASDPVGQRLFRITTELFLQVFGPIYNRDSFLTVPTILRPKSRGRVMLKDTNYNTFPVIFPNYFDHPDDMKLMIKSIRLILNITAQPAMAEIAKFHDIPILQCATYPFASDEYFDCMIRYFTTTLYHPCGTCKMGPPEDKEAVVDPRLRVYGIKNLRVVDGSIIPEIPAAHLNGPIMMIAEKTADLIKEEWS